VAAFRLAFLQVCALSCLACSPAQEHQSIDLLLESAVANGGVPGAIAVAANSDGVIYEGAFGKSDIQSNSDMSIDSILQIYSMTKPITSVAIMQLVEKGDIDLDAAASEYLPMLADVQVLDGFDENGAPLLRTPKTDVTVRQLLTHTSGYVYEIWNANAARYAQTGGVESIFNDGDGFLAAPLAFDPGTNWEYGISTDVLGEIIAAVAEQSLEEYFRIHVFAPLNMNDTSFHLAEQDLPRLATAYSRSGNGDLTALPARSNTASLRGGSGLVSTAPDYIRFLRALLNGGELDGARILNAETVELMAKNQIGDLEAGASGISVMPQLSRTFEFFPESVDKFGLGFLINGEPVPGGRAAGSLAWAGLANTFFWIDFENDMCGVVMTQILPFGDPAALALLEDFERAVYRRAKQSDR
jgi:CubicO group peptidase (beta-lactamase class C family)